MDLRHLAAMGAGFGIDFIAAQRELHAFKTSKGVERARRAGQRIGRPPKPGPAGKAIRVLRANGMSWREIAQEFGCTMALVRRRAVAE